ncbi:Clr5 domain-containing protein [Fusarium keratoplasticum]|uniref:Clr5 domain-containing protein n=1 Tax=Fusarium keratoplasticum TaxID=1328300 RepID=A0ACC0RFB7_9HYPO|nr:Clr5 domain-containing protein [Fusarium keratoplasticum]KAI8684801.1 Clr5 domain-containing protein [Fusarium keratoplasticum]
MVYQWGPHRDVCYRMYITERQSLESIMEHLKKVYQFTPSKRAFQVQFKRWNFPLKQRPAHKDPRLVKRVHELWLKNMPQGEMLRILKDEEGYDINSRELMRVRARNRWLLRIRHGDRAKPDDEEEEPESPEAQEGGSTADQEGASHQPISNPTTPFVLTPKPRKLSKRQSRRNRQQLADENDLVRFPSEMTLIDCKDVLRLDSTTYSETRECFGRICQQESIVKKTLAGPDKWEYVKNRLIHERPHLQEVLWVSKEKLETKQLALDIICTDVTKRLRNMDTKMTLLDAKNVLGLNPEESREIRTALYTVLCDANFTCKSDVNPGEWEELKRLWMEKSVHVKKLSLTGDDAETRKRVRALEILARDVIKRRRDDYRHQNPKGSEPAKQKEAQRSQTPQDGRNREQLQQPSSKESPSSAFAVSDRDAARSSSPAAPPPMTDDGLGEDMDSSTFEPIPEVTRDSRVPFVSAGRSMPPQLPTPVPSQTSLASSNGVLPQPPRMLGSSASTPMSVNSQYGSPLYMGANTQSAFMGQQYVAQQFSPAPSTAMFQGVPAVSTSFAIFLRLHPSSTIVANTGLWIGTMSAHSVQELRDVAVAKFPGAICVRIEGIIKDDKGTELPLQIQDDEELTAYFAHMRGGSPTFAVQLV